jgi:hypothetical protein
MRQQGTSSLMGFDTTINFGNGREPHFTGAYRKLRESTTACVDPAYSAGSDLLVRSNVAENS